MKKKYKDYIKEIDKMILEIPKKSDIDTLWVSNEIYNNIKHKLINDTYKGYKVNYNKLIPKKHMYAINNKYHL